MYKLLKLLFINLAVILILIVSIDIIFGYWFDKNNFGPNMRGKRVQKIVFNHDNKKTYYLRDFYMDIVIDLFGNNHTLLHTLF